MFDVCVSGKKNSILGFLVEALVVVEPDTDKQELKQYILEHCRSSLVKWQIPAFICFVSSLEESSNGKKRRMLV